MNAWKTSVMVGLGSLVSSLSQASPLEVEAYTAVDVPVVDGATVAGALTEGMRFLVTAPDAGVVDRLLVAEGDVIERGTAIGNIAHGYPPFSPASGRVVEVRVKRDDAVEAGQVLAVVESDVRLGLEFGLPTQFRATFARGIPVTFRLPEAPDELLRGVFVDAGLQYSEELKGTRAVAMVDNPDGRLEPGMPVEVILSGNPRISLQLPKTALIPNNVAGVVWKIVEDDGVLTVEPAAVRTGVDLEEGMVEVVSGLIPGDRVVADLTDLQLSPGREVVIRGEPESMH